MTLKIFNIPVILHKHRLKYIFLETVYIAQAFQKAERKLREPRYCFFKQNVIFFINALVAEKIDFGYF